MTMKESPEKTLLVLGASSDVGLALLNELGAEFDHVLLQYRTMNEGLVQLRERLAAKADLFKADLSLSEDAERLAQWVLGKPNSVTHLVHLASSPAVNVKFHKAAPELCADLMNTNVLGILPVLRVVLAQMLRQRRGRMVFMLSSYVLGERPPRYQDPYVTAKYALLGLMRALAQDYAAQGVTVNAVAPDMMDTRFLKDLPEQIVQAHALAMPFKRNLTPKDVLPAFRLLLSDEGAAITGVNLAVTAGA